MNEANARPMVNVTRYTRTTAVTDLVVLDAPQASHQSLFSACLVVTPVIINRVVRNVPQVSNLPVFLVRPPTVINLAARDANRKM